MNLSKTKFFLAFILIGILFFIIYNGKPTSRQWYKGNLHTHSLWSDGDAFPEMAAGWYKSHGYHFVNSVDTGLYANKRKLLIY